MEHLRQYSRSFLTSIAKYMKNSSTAQEKDESFCAEQNNSSSSAAPTTDCLATTQGGDLNRQSDWKQSKTRTSGDTPMVPFVTKRIVRFVGLYFITSALGCKGMKEIICKNFAGGCKISGDSMEKMRK